MYTYVHLQQRHIFSIHAYVNICSYYFCIQEILSGWVFLLQGPCDIYLIKTSYWGYRSSVTRIPVNVTARRLYCRFFNTLFIGFVFKVQHFAIVLLVFFLPSSRLQGARSKRIMLQTIEQLIQFSQLLPQKQIFLVYHFSEQVASNGNSTETIL